jgi:hypothetical protein
MTTENEQAVAHTEMSHPVAHSAMSHPAVVTLSGPVDEMEKRFGFAKKIAQLMADSALVPKEYQGSPANCFIAIQMGAELGLGPFQAVQSIAVIDGRPSVWGDALLGLVRASGKLEYIKEWVEEVEGKGPTAYCEVLRRGDKEPILRVFSLQDAARANLLKRWSYQSYPARMVQMRARAYALRDGFADVLKGIAVAEELQDWAYAEQAMAPASKPVSGPSAGDSPGASLPPQADAGAAPDYEELSEALMQASSISALLKLKPRIRDYPDEADREVLQKLYNQRRDEVKK